MNVYAPERVVRAGASRSSPARSRPVRREAAAPARALGRPAPNGIGQQKPNHYGEMAKVAWANRAHPKYAWDVLTKGVCDGCALGVAGLHDWTIDGVHLCTTRLRLLEVNTADAIDPIVLADVEPLRRALGRGAAGPRPPRPPDAAPPGRAGLPPHRVGRGARRRSAGAIARRRRRPHRRST